ncbi:Spy/CpxP family protein refolding chaperone [Ferrimonas sp.]|uniref:Spy/CpxP family protein refolding chaperone n=1 Tax=Ferrimonas sp. TaxID=2080861 RepID=UPI003A9475D9
MKLTKTLTLAAVAGLVLSMTAVSTASAKNHGQGYHQEMGGEFHQGGGKHMKRMLRGLDLTDEQKQQVKDILTKAKADRPERDPQFMKAQMERHHQLMLAAEFDEQAAREAIAVRQAKMAEMQLKQMKVQHEIMQLLTAEQKQKLEERRAERMKRFEDRF